MTVTEAAQRLRVSTKTIYRWIGRGQLHTTRVGADKTWRHDIDIYDLIAADDARLS